MASLPSSKTKVKPLGLGRVDLGFVGPKGKTIYVHVAKEQAAERDHAWRPTTCRWVHSSEATNTVTAATPPRREQRWQCRTRELAFLQEQRATHSHQPSNPRHHRSKIRDQPHRHGPRDRTWHRQPNHEASRSRPHGHRHRNRRPYGPSSREARAPTRPPAQAQRN